jgi:hypothetical protein
LRGWGAAKAGGRRLSAHRTAWLLAGTCLGGLAGEPALAADVTIVDGQTRTTTLSIFNGTLTVEALGAISTTGGAHGVVAQNNNANVINFGTISGAGVDGFGQEANGVLHDNGSLTFDNRGSVTGLGYGIRSLVTSPTMILTNSGTIVGTTVDGFRGGVATVTNSGSITGEEDGIGFFYGTVTNSGTITANTRYSIRGHNGDSTVENTASGIINGVLSINGGLTLTNAGTINGSVVSEHDQINGVNTGTITADTAVYARSGSFTNAGTLTGTSGTAVDFTTNLYQAIALTLTLESPSVINGLVLGRPNSTVDKLALGGATDGTFDASEIGAAQKYRDFDMYEKVGTSTWRLTGAGAQDWTVTAGTLTGDSNSLQGAAITNNATLGFEQNFDGTYGGVIGGTGSLSKTGTGRLTLTGTQTYLGGTAIGGGTLAVNGSIASSSGVTINNGGVLGGNGIVAPVTVNAGGTLAPGNSIGVITVNNTLVFTGGGIYAVEVSPTDADRTDVVGAPATASLAGTVQATFAAGGYVLRSYTILTATGGLGGTKFDALSTVNLPAGFAATLGYSGNAVTLNLALALTQMEGLDGNQQAVADAIDLTDILNQADRGYCAT